MYNFIECNRNQMYLIGLGSPIIAPRIRGENNKSLDRIGIVLNIETSYDLIRQFFPKGTDFSRVSLKRIKQAQDMLKRPTTEDFKILDTE